jgi:AraC-like DNA-binding protein
MQRASRLLLEGESVAGTAGVVGYESEAAFSRAFKKLVGKAPATWRRTSLARAQSPAARATLPRPPRA